MQEVSERHIEADYSNKGDIAAEGDYNKSIQSQLSRRIDNISADNEVSDSDGENEHKISKSLGTNSIDEHNDSKEKFNKSKGTTESFNPLNKVEDSIKDEIGKESKSKAEEQEDIEGVSKTEESKINLEPTARVAESVINTMKSNDNKEKTRKQQMMVVMKAIKRTTLIKITIVIIDSINILIVSHIVDNYVPESKLFAYESLKQSPNFKVKDYEYAEYRGEVINKLETNVEIEQRHGFGSMIYKSGRIYEGQWINDKRNGKGYERYKNGNIYEGDFKDGKAHGGGVFKWTTGEVYDGQWERGLKNGYGIWRGVEGEYYIGEWKDSRTHGKGMYVWSNGDKYEGDWRNGLKHGQGCDIFKNGDVYIGTYKFGKPDGDGQYTWRNGCIYRGKFINGMKHGHGKWMKDRNPTSNCYEGEYSMDQKQGYGEFKWSSGNVYRGAYKNDLRNGYGEMYWTDGSIYKGNWVNGIQHGLGKMFFIDGTVNEGIFEHNIFKGPNGNRNEDIMEESYEDDNTYPEQDLK